MTILEKLIITEDVSLIVLHHCPEDINFISTVFEKLADKEINVDMISLSPPKGGSSTLSFTILDEALEHTLEVLADLRAEFSKIKPMISSGNSKIQVCSEKMRTTFGVASKVLKAAAEVNADIRLITTSEIDISLLVTKADETATYYAILKNLS